MMIFYEQDLDEIELIQFFSFMISTFFCFV